MGAEASILSVLPNLGIGVVSVLTLGFMADRFLKALDARAQAHEAAMLEREQALRNVEEGMRGQLFNIISQSNQVIAENSLVLGRVVRHLDGDSHH